MNSAHKGSTKRSQRINGTLDRVYLLDESSVEWWELTVRCCGFRPLYFLTVFQRLYLHCVFSSLLNLVPRVSPLWFDLHSGEQKTFHVFTWGLIKLAYRFGSKRIKVFRKNQQATGKLFPPLCRVIYSIKIRQNWYFYILQRTLYWTGLEAPLSAVQFISKGSSDGAKKKVHWRWS